MRNSQRVVRDHRVDRRAKLNASGFDAYSKFPIEADRAGITSNAMARSLAQRESRTQKTVILIKQISRLQ
jgi:putative hemolysin